MFSIGPLQVVLILVLVLILFGAGKLPKVMGDLAKGVKNFKAGLKDDDDAQDDKVLSSDATPKSSESSLKQDEAAKS